MPTPRDKDKDAYLTPYRKHAQSHGTGFGVTLWASPESQRHRFHCMTDLANFTGKRVLDAGCSRGDFAAYLIEKGYLFDQYIGLDGIDEVIQYARTRDMARTEFHTADFLADPTLLKTGNPQIITISGTLNTMAFPEALRVLEGAWDACSEALIFNFLSDRCGAKAPPQAYPAHRLDTMKFIDWALDQTWCVRFRQDYFRYGHDATIFMAKDAPVPAV